jgi:hypothetical protein
MIIALNEYLDNCANRTKKEPNEQLTVELSRPSRARVGWSDLFGGGVPGHVFITSGESSSP